jgi:hypothetical protein
MDKRKVTAGAFLITAALTSPSVSAENNPQDHIVAYPDRVTVHNGANSASISFPRRKRGITEIGIERLDFSTNAYVTMVTASGPHLDDAAIAAASVRTLTNLNHQTLFTDTESITFAYNQAKPSYVISELERARLISPVEAQAARAAFYSLQTSRGLRP